MSTQSKEYMLDNVVWYSLLTHHAHLAIGGPLAKRHPADIIITVAVAQHDEPSLEALRGIVSEGETVAFFERDPVAPLPGWTVQVSATVDQMVCTQPPAGDYGTANIIPLTAADVPDMLRLVELAQPGPMTPRSIELGQFFGIRVAGELVAMAGQRYHPGGYQELSTICTHPDHQGKGYARHVTARLVQEIWNAGEIPFLHVRAENSRAIRLYESLHFKKRCDIQLVIANY